MSPLTQTSTPPIASDMSITPVHRIAAAKWISSPVSASIVSAVHASPPYVYEALSGCELIAEYSPPSPSGHAGIGTSMSRGNETTVMRRGSSLICTSIVTSLRSPSASSFAQRGKSATSCPSHESDPTIRTFTPPSISPIDGGSALSPTRSTEFSRTVESASHTANAVTPAALTPITAKATPRIDKTRRSGCRTPCTA